MTALIRALDVRNNPSFLPGTLLVPPELAPKGTELAEWAGKKFGVMRYTRCNGYAVALFAGLGCPLPATKTANGLLEWLADETRGKAAGWSEVQLAEAIQLTNAGFPVAIVAHDDPHGHIAAGAPNPSDPERLYCTAAGSANTQLQLVTVQFGHLAARARYFTHD